MLWSTATGKDRAIPDLVAEELALQLEPPSAGIVLHAKGVASCLLQEPHGSRHLHGQLSREGTRLRQGTCCHCRWNRNRHRLPFSRRDGPLVRHVPHDSLRRKRKPSMTSYPTATWCLLPATVRMPACVCACASLLLQPKVPTTPSHVAGVVEFHSGFRPSVLSLRAAPLPNGKRKIRRRNIRQRDSSVAAAASNISGHCFRSAYARVRPKCCCTNVFKQDVLCFFPFQ